MNANELRIGNYVDRLVYDSKNGINSPLIAHNHIYTVYGINEKKINIGFKYEVEKILPIKLTEEWLIKFGFEKKLNRDECFYTNKNRTIDLYLSDGFYLELNGNSFKIEYVHKFQNIVHDLTDKELKLPPLQIDPFIF